MIVPKQPPPLGAVAAHYDELDGFYRDVWGEHVHHGYWATGHESAAEAVVALVELLARRLRLAPGQVACDIGCGYGATARHLAEHHHVNVTGVTISAAQAQRAQARDAQTQITPRDAQTRITARAAPTRIAAPGGLSILWQDWLANDFASEHFDCAYSVESSEHMPNKQRFFDEAFRTLKPGALFAVFAWLARDEPRPWEVRHLLEPICREGRLPGMGDEGDYCRLAERAGFEVASIEDLSDKVRRTWRICARRALARLLTRSQYRRFLMDRSAANRIFALTMIRIMIAYRTGSMRYCLFVFRRPA